MYHYVDAEVPGALAPGSSYDPEVRAEESGPLHLVFDGWMGDDLVTTSPFWFVTERLADALRESGLSGFALEPATATTGEQYELASERSLPPTWFRLIPEGSVDDDDDFVFEDGTDLVVSDAALALLRSFTLDEADVAEYDDGPTQSPVMQRYLAEHGEGE